MTEPSIYCPSCGKAWPLPSLALECCTPERLERLARHAKEQRHG